VWNLFKKRQSNKFQLCLRKEFNITKCVEKLPHSCGSGDGLQVFLKDDKTYDGYCFSCGTYVASPYHDKPEGYKPQVIIKSQEQIDAEIAEIEHYTVVDLPDRKLRKESLNYFGIKIGVSEQDGITPVSHYYPYYKNGVLVGYKVRLIENKRMWAIGSTKQSDLFGWNQAVAAGGKKLFITEGELDAVALFQIMKDHNKGTQWAELNPSVVSIPNGSGGAAKDILRLLPEIRKVFKEIVLVFDNDDPGKKATEEVIRNVPDAIVATLPSKDANQCLMDGRSKAAYNACQFNAQKPKNTRLILGDELHESAKEPPVYGVSWPWKHITEATRGIRLGETIYIGAGQKQG
jgi:twinkle protein